MEKIAYGGWPNCYRLANDTLELVATTDVGPRLIRCAFTGGDNLFYEAAGQLGLTGGEAWRLYGGHRLWHAPEEPPRTYYPDTQPVRIQEFGGFVRLTQPVETTTGIQKEMDLLLAPTGARLTLVHRLTNRSLWPVTLAPWALTVMAPGGQALVPLPPPGVHGEVLLPDRSLVLWPYSDLTDSRWRWGADYIGLRQEPGRPEPQKAGLGGPLPGWLAYERQGQLFVKQSPVQPAATYPDRGCAIELFTDGEMLELETLGPLTTLPPGGSVEHVERWYLFTGAPSADDPAAVIAFVNQALNRAPGP